MRERESYRGRRKVQSLLNAPSPARRAMCRSGPRWPSVPFRRPPESRKGSAQGGQVNGRMPEACTPCVTSSESFREIHLSFHVSLILFLLTKRVSERERSIVHGKKSRRLHTRGLLMRMDFGPDAQSDRPPREAAVRSVGTRSKGVETFQNKLAFSGN